MGVCGEQKDKKKKPEKEENKILTNEITPIEEGKKDDKLKSVPNMKKSYAIKILNTDNNQGYNKVIDGDITIHQMLSEMKFRENCDFIIEFENNLKIGAEKINVKLENILIEIFNSDIPEVIEMKYSYKGLNIPENAIEAYRKDNKIIGSAIMDSTDIFGIITYEINTRSLNPYYYQRNEYPELIYFNSFTAYCNAKNCLYFSGGEKEQSYEVEEKSAQYNEFISIDLTKLSSNNDKLEINQLPNLNVPRTWHSMIFVPNKYIFIVGGSNTKSVELYDMEEKKLTKDSELNEERCEATLCLVNNIYLYAFYGFFLHKDYNNSIERCNLLKEERKWEDIYAVEKSALRFKPSFFAISYFKNDLLLIGGNDAGEEERYDYLYKLENEEDKKDEILDYKFESKEKINIFKDKFFMPIDNNKAVNIPLSIGGEIKVFILDTQTGKVISYDNNNK